MKLHKIKKYIPFITLVCLLLFLGYLTLGGMHRSSKIAGKGGAQSNENKPSSGYTLPVALENKNVGAVLVHYFFTGKLKELEKTAAGTKIVFLDADPGLPDLIIARDTRISRLTPPYEQNHTEININTLKPGNTIDVSAEFDVRAGAWFVRDVYMPTDRN